MKLCIHAGLALPSYVYALMYGLQVTLGFEWCCSVLGTDMCTSYSHLSIPVDLLKFIKVWMNGWFNCVRSLEVVSDWLSLVDSKINYWVVMIGWCRCIL